MRKILCEALLKRASDPEFVFLTGDLGFMALEPLQKGLGARFINAGVAEQNMVSVAAGMAMLGLRPWVYSIGPFIYARPYEQIRNDICMHDLPVVLVGNGGGYAYGAMGGTHHALEDYGSLLCLPHMHVFIPAFSEDVSEIINKLFRFEHPTYLRLGRCELPKDVKLPAYAMWRRLMSGGGTTMLVIGPLAGSLIGVLNKLDEHLKPNLWVLTELPVNKNTIPEDFIHDIRRSGHLYVIEEHVAFGGVGQMISHCLLELGEPPIHFTHRYALGYISGLYGSQNFHRRECGLDPESILTELVEG